MLLRPLAFWAKRRIELLLGRSVEKVEPALRVSITGTGERFGYRHLVWAAGSDARRLACSGHHLAGVHSVRCRADVDRMLGELRHIAEVVIIGGG